MKVGAGHRAAKVPNARWRRRQWCPERSKEHYKHGRYTKEVAATRQWLREAIRTLLHKRP